ncbi:MAG: alpha-ketoglutarate-dependent dioxygenase AlkB [Bacteroidota bacterium]
MNLFEQFNEDNDLLSIRQFDLPQADITLYEHFFTKAESDQLYNILIEKTIWQQDHIKLYGKKIALPRLTAWYGNTNEHYHYSGISMPINNWTEDLLFIKARIEIYTKNNFTGVLLNYYRDGQDSVGWHSDDEKELGTNPVIASVSLGETRLFQMRSLTDKKIKKVDIPLTHGSLLIMKGATQHFWEHRVPKTTKAVSPRINLTFRVL